MATTSPSKALTLALVDLLIFSAVDFPLMVLWQKEPWPHWPSIETIQENTSDGSWYHEAKGYWSEVVRADGEYWSKLFRFLLWWSICLTVLSMILAA